MELAIILVLLYFVPSMVAAGCNCKHTAAIVALNILLGWTALGWVGALVWALAEKEEAA